MLSNKFYTVFLILISLLNYSCDNSITKSDLVIFTGSTMGTTYNIKIVPNNSVSIPTNFNSLIDSLLQKINQQMSTYITDSELSLFNSFEDTIWYNVSPQVAEIFNNSINISRLTGGSFDITIGPLVNLWGFGPTSKPHKIPDKSQIDSLLKTIGYQNLYVDLQNNRVKKKLPNLYCDLSAIAKGYGVDAVAKFIESFEIENYMVEIGGEVRTKGFNQYNKKWKIGISSPNNLELQKIIELSGMAMATSGDYLNYFEENGKRYSHTINPSTGKPITHKLASVTVISDKCEFADAIATAINVMGPDEGFQFALVQKLPAFFIVREGEKYFEKFTPQFEDLFIKEN